jgi:hypothetical protein
MMVRKFCSLPVVFFCIVVNPRTITKLFAQEPIRNESNFMILIEAGLPSGVSSSMRGTNAEFASDIQRDFNNRKYPFGDQNASGVQFGIEARYRFASSNLGAYAGLHLTAFGTYGSSSGQFAGDSAYLGAGTFSIGGAYSYDLTPHFDLNGRIGLNASLVLGSVVTPFFTTKIPATYRIGYEFGLNIDWKPGSLFVFSVGAGYANVNVIGRSYTSPPSGPIILNRTLNDGANPNDASDNGRTIDFVSLNISAGIRF